MVANKNSIRDKWSGQSCTLDGKPAKVTGRLLDFAVISPLDHKIGQVEFSWAAVDLIMSHNGKFSSK